MQKFERHSKVELGVVFDTISDFVETHEIDLSNLASIHGGTTSKNKRRVEIHGVPVRVASLRLLTFFKTGIKCHCCGVSATHFAIERNPRPGINNSPFHLNLWGDVDNGEVLFTHDHIIAKANGGEDNLSNTQTMCLPCNMEKGSS
jgi:hypothetical protein